MSIDWMPTPLCNRWAYQTLTESEWTLIATNTKNQPRFNSGPNLNRLASPHRLARCQPWSCPALKLSTSTIPFPSYRDPTKRIIWSSSNARILSKLWRKLKTTTRLWMLLWIEGQGPWKQQLSKIAKPGSKISTGWTVPSITITTTTWELVRERMMP